MLAASCFLLHLFSLFLKSYLFSSISFCYLLHLVLLIKISEILAWIMGDSSASYIHMVQHLIEKCLIFHMSKEECMEALSKHANIKPVITSTVWNELEKENKEFFEAYAQSQRKSGRMSEEETSQMIHKMISDSSSKDSDE